LRRGFGYGLFGALAYLVWLLATLPAPLVYSRFEADLAPLSLHPLSGTLWHGRASVITHGQRLAQSLVWKFNPWALVKARLELRWSIADPHVQGQGRAGLMLIGGEYYLSDLEVRLPAKVLSTWLTLDPFVLGGALVLDVAMLAGNREGWHTVDGWLTWRDAAVEQPERIALGGLTLALSPYDTGGLLGKVRESKGPLAVAGELRLDTEGSWQIHADLAARPPEDARLKKMLQVFGRPGVDGKIRLDWRSRFD
jgi:hypothetical protein